MSLKKIKNAIKANGFRGVVLKIINRLRFIYLRKKYSKECEFKKWETIKNKYRGKSVFLIGNGPSLNRTPLYYLKNEYKMCFNRFNVMGERLNWVPDFFLTVDNLVLNDMLDELEQIIPHTKHSFFPGVHFRGDVFVNKIKHDNVFFTKQLIVSNGFSENLPKIITGGTVIYEGFRF